MRVSIRFGLAFEGYGPVGETRTKDLAGRAVDTQRDFPGGSQGAGLEGLQSYIRAHREKDFVDNLCRKMLVYALGRSLMLSDEPLIERMNAKLAAERYRMGALIETIVTSPQFLKNANTELRKVASEMKSDPPHGSSRRRSHHGAAVARIAVCVRRNAPRARPSRSASGWSSWATASTRITGAPRDRATT